MNARFLQIAKAELDGAVDYYNQEKPGLASRRHLAGTPATSRPTASAILHSPHLDQRTRAPSHPQAPLR
jgi:hypothetical protein